MLLGRTVVGVEPNYDIATIDLDSGQRIYLYLENDCCSESFFTDPAQFIDLIGAKLQRIERRYGLSGPNAPNPPCRQDEMKWHFLVFETSKGHITIDWRNDSNGYYDGTVNIEVCLEGLEQARSAYKYEYD